MKVLQFPTLFAIGGTERQIMNLARGLEPKHFDVHFACLKRVGQYVEEIERAGRTLTEYRIDRVYGGRTMCRQVEFARDLRRRGISVVHTYGFWPNVFGIPAARLAGTPVVLGAIRDGGDHITPAQRRVQRIVCRMADGIVVNAEAIRRRLTQEGYDPRRISVVPNGIDLTPFGRPRPRGRLRRALGLPADAPLVAVFARVAPVKGLEYFLQAAKGVHESFPSARFLVVGETRALAYGVPVPSHYTQGLQAMAAALGLGDRVIFTGVREDVPEFMEEVSVVVSPSLDEGLSNSVLEAMAARAPLVATRVGGTPEAVEDGVTGLLVPAQDAGALARAIGTLLADRELARRLGEAARQHIAEQFSIERMVSRTAQLYSTLVEERVH